MAKKNLSFSLHGLFNFEIAGKGKLFDYLDFQFNYFTANTNPSTSKLKINVIEKDNNIVHECLKTKAGYFGRNSERFFWQNAGGSVVLKGSDDLSKIKNITFSNAFPKLAANTVCDLFFRLHLADSGISTIHASCVASSNNALLIPAWKGSGKTTLSLKLVQQGYSFMADDKVFLGNDRNVYSYPRYVVIKDSNAIHFKSLIGSKKHLGFKLINKVNNNASSWYQRQLVRLIKKMFNVKPLHFHITSLIPEACISKRSQIKRVCFVIRDKSVDKGKIIAVDPEETINRITHVNQYEWNLELFEMALAHDLLFNNSPCWTKEIKHLIESETQIIRSALSGAQFYKVVLPYDESMIDYDQVVSNLNSK